MDWSRVNDLRGEGGGDLRPSDPAPLSGMGGILACGNCAVGSPCAVTHAVYARGSPVGGMTSPDVYCGLVTRWLIDERNPGAAPGFRGTSTVSTLCDITVARYCGSVRYLDLADLLRIR